MSEGTKQTENTAENGNKSKPMLQAVFLAPYLTYGLKIEHPTFKIGVRKISELKNLGQTNIEISHRMFVQISECKPVLNPFSDYSEIQEITDEMNDYEIMMVEDNPDLIKRLPYDVIEKMFKNHIDIFGLINFGLAISIHDVE